MPLTPHTLPHMHTPLKNTTQGVFPGPEQEYKCRPVYHVLNT